MWNRRGFVFVPDKAHKWMQSHASNPIVESLSKDRCRVYFGTRDERNRSHVGWIDVEFGDKPRILRVATEPVLSPGERGYFDDNGISVGSIVHFEDKAYFYYVGWNLGVSVPWRNSIGLAIRHSKDGSFVKHSTVPILDRSEEDPLSMSYPWVIRTRTRWEMWYGSNLSWGPGPKEMKHRLKYAISDDGIRWQRLGPITFRGFDLENEIACRPTVLIQDGVYRMWYCHSWPNYRLGFAESRNGIDWVAKKCKLLDVSPAGWDSEMIAYPCIFSWDDQLHLLYNGNRYGKTGFGWSTLENELLPLV